MEHFELIWNSHYKTLNVINARSSIIHETLMFSFSHISDIKKKSILYSKGYEMLMDKMKGLSRSYDRISCCTLNKEAEWDEIRVGNGLRNPIKKVIHEFYKYDVPILLGESSSTPNVSRTRIDVVYHYLMLKEEDFKEGDEYRLGLQKGREEKEIEEKKKLLKEQNKKGCMTWFIKVHP
jgi:hypothetical protein